MPIYEYRCGECGHQKEVLQRISDAPLTDCPECGKRAFNKMVTAAGFQLKGTGWYATDFKHSGSKPAAKSDKNADSAKSPDAAAKETAKPETAKPETAKPEAAKPEAAKPKTACGAGA